MSTALKEDNLLLNSNTPKIYQQQIINQSKLLIKIKELIESKEYSLAKLYLFIMKLSNKSKNFGVKIQIIYFLSEISLKEKNEEESIKIGHKIISWINKLDLKKYNDEVIISFLHILLNSSEICENNNSIMFSCWFLFVAKNLCMEKSIKDEYINERIQSNFPIIIKKLKEEIDDIKENIMDKKNDFLRLADEVKKYIKNKNNDIIYKNIKKGEKFYIINEKWVNNFLNFVSKITNLNKYKNKNELDYIFDVNSICLSYFYNNDIENIEKEEIDFNGIYCGKINNFNYIKLKNIWPDNEQNYSNIFVNKNILNNSKNEKFLLFEEDNIKKLNLI